MKLDFKKAYDSMDHKFLIDMLEKWVLGLNGESGYGSVSLRRNY